MKILCIDDEPLILKVMVRLLPGHDIMCYVDPCAAVIHLLGQDAPVYDVILCDLTMPACSGIDVHGALVRQRPELALKIIFLTGMSVIPGMNVFLDSVPNVRLEKPFDRQGLVDAIELVARPP